MKTMMRGTLAGLVLATALGAAACGPRVKQQSGPANMPVRETVVGVPTGEVQRSVMLEPTYHSANAYVIGSYTFPLTVNGKDACAQHFRSALNDMSPALDAEYDAMVISRAARDRQPVTFQHEGFTGNGCYHMVSRPQLVPGQR